MTVGAHQPTPRHRPPARSGRGGPVTWKTDPEPDVLNEVRDLIRAGDFDKAETTLAAIKAKDALEADLEDAGDDLEKLAEVIENHRPPKPALRTSPRRTRERDRVIADLYEAGKTQQWIAEEVGCHRNTVRNALRRRGLLS